MRLFRQRRIRLRRRRKPGTIAPPASRLAFLIIKDAGFSSLASGKAYRSWPEHDPGGLRVEASSVEAVLVPNQAPRLPPQVLT